MVDSTDSFTVKRPMSLKACMTVARYLSTESSAPKKLASWVGAKPGLLGERWGLSSPQTLAHHYCRTSHDLTQSSCSKNLSLASSLQISLFELQMLSSYNKS